MKRGSQCLGENADFVHLSIADVDRSLLAVCFCIPTDVDGVGEVPDIARCLCGGLFCSVYIDGHFLSVVDARHLMPVVFPVSRQGGAYGMLFISIDIKFQFVFTALLQPELIIAFVMNEPQLLTSFRGRFCK